jgi:hypothetical protein
MPGLKTRGLRLQCQQLGLVLTQGRAVARWIDAQDDLTLLHMLAGMHQDFLDDAAVQALHHLNLARRNHLALTPHHFVDAPQAAQSSRTSTVTRGHPYQQARTTRLLLPCRPLRVGLEVIRLMRSDHLAAVKQPSLQPRPARLRAPLKRRLFSIWTRSCSPSYSTNPSCFSASIT